ncbi:MAG: hypothetical protein WBC06_09140 [Chitinophagaceae bacterium]
MNLSCKELNLIFRESEQKFSDSLITYKTKINNAYWGKIKSGGEFPRKSGTDIKIVKIGRSIINPVRWQGVSDSLCSTNLCENPAQDIIYNGFEEDSYSLARTSFRTDWLCLDSLEFREMASVELENFEDNIRQAARYTWEEFGRSRYIDMCGNKMLAMVDAEDLTDGCCDTLKVKCTDDSINSSDGFKWARYPKLDGTPGEINENYVFVNCDPDHIPRIAELSLDLLDYAAQDLELEDDMFSFLDEGIDLLDVVLGHSKMGNRFATQEDRRMNNAISYGGYDPQQLKKTLGTKNVFRERYSTRYDPNSARFYPDTDYNTALTEAEGYAYSASDPDTWPRFARVYPYNPRASTKENGGVMWVPNKMNYIRAPFCISTVFSPNVCAFESFPESKGMGSARKEGVGLAHNYAGKAVWHSPPWECNIDGNKGFWKLDFGAAVRPIKRELGWAVFHRVDHRISLQANCCDIPVKACIAPVAPYCFNGMGGTEESLEGTSGQNRPSFYGTITIN